MAGRDTLCLWVVLTTTAVVFAAGPAGGDRHLQGRQGFAYDQQQPVVEMIANTKTTKRPGPKKKRDYSNHPWKKNWPDFRTTPRAPKAVLADDKYDRKYDSFAVDRSEDPSQYPDDIRLQKGGIGNRSYTWTPNPRQPPRHPWQKTWPDTRPYHFADPGPGPHRPKKDQEENTEKKNQKKRDKNKKLYKKNKSQKKKKSLVSAFLDPQLIHDVSNKRLKATLNPEVEKPLHPWRNKKPTLVDLKQRVRRAATTEAPHSLFMKGPKKMLNEGLGFMQQQLNRILPTSITSPKSTVRVTLGQLVQPTTLKPNDASLRKIAVETTTQDRSIITAPLKSCPDGQRMGPNRVCVANYTDPEGSD